MEERLAQLKNQLLNERSKRAAQGDGPIWSTAQAGPVGGYGKSLLKDKIDPSKPIKVSLFLLFLTFNFCCTQLIVAHKQLQLLKDIPATNSASSATSSVRSQGEWLTSTMGNGREDSARSVAKRIMCGQCEKASAFVVRHSCFLFIYSAFVFVLMDDFFLLGCARNV